MGRGGTMAQAATLGFAVERHALATAWTQRSRHTRLKHARDRRSHSGRIEPRQKALDGSLMRGGGTAKHQRAADVTGLARGP